MTNPVRPQPQAATSYRAGLDDTRSDDRWESLEQAGWSNTPRIDVGAGPFQSLSWGNLRTLAAAYREKLGRWYTIAPDAAMRQAWMTEQLPWNPVARALRVEDPISLDTPTPGDRFRVLLLGDTGDASQAQRAVALQLWGRARQPGVKLGAKRVSAIVIESDIIYPAGAGSEYGAKFSGPYWELLERERLDDGVPIYAVPGNHDWDDGSLIGFMSAFCGVTSLPASVPAARNEALKSGRSQLLKLAWLNGKPVSGTLAPSGTDPDTRQPGPYFALDVGGALYIGIDTGYGATIDIDQARWLVKMVESHPTMPKLLFSGKPLIVNGSRAPCQFVPVPGDDLTKVPSGDVVYASVDDVVRRPENGFIAVIGGDVHNYQRYVAHIVAPDSNERILPYLVCGGGGVFIGQTSSFGPVAIDDETDGTDPERVFCREDETVLFPQRAHSRLFLQAIVRRSVQHARFTLPIALAAAGLLTVLAAAVNVVVRGSFHAPHGVSGLALIPIAIAVNISARPITIKAVLLCVGFGVIGAALIYCAQPPQGYDSVTPDDAKRAIVAALLGGLGLLAIGSFAGLWRLVRTGLSLVGSVMVAGGSFAVVFLSIPRERYTDLVVAIIVAAALVIVLYATEAFRRNITVEKAFEEEPRWLSRKLSARQRVFSLYETFTDGRLEHRRRLKSEGVSRRVKLPLYRSYLEIEHFQDVSGRWTFAFTAIGVTGEENTDTNLGSTHRPRKVDAFEVCWAPGRRLEFVISGPPDE